MQLKVSYFSCCRFYLLGSMLKPFGYSVSHFRIQKFYLPVSRWVRVSLYLEMFVNWSLMMNFECLLKVWLSSWKCFEAIHASTFFTSFCWLFSFVSKVVSVFFYILYYIKYTPSNIECSYWRSWRCGISYIFFWFVDSLK